MRLLDSQEVAVQRVQERNRLVATYESLLAQYKTVTKDLAAIQIKLEQLNNEVLANLKKL